MLNMFLVCVLILLSTLYVFFKKRFRFWKDKNVYTESPSVPFGNAKSMLLQQESVDSGFKRLYEECRRRSLPYCGFYFLTTPILIVADLDLIKRIMKTDFNHFTDRVFHSSENDPLSLNLGSASGTRWKGLRNKLSPLFTPTKIKHMYEIIENCTLEVISHLDEFASMGETVEVNDLASRFMMDIFVTSSFGLECKTVKNQNLGFLAIAASFYNTSFKDALIRMLSMTNSKLLNMLNIKSVKPDIEEFFLTQTEAIVKDRETNNIVKKDLMHTLIQIKNNVQIEDYENINNVHNTTVSLTTSEIAAQCYIFFVAGVETTSSTISFCLYELALNLAYQEEARKEVEMALCKHGGVFSFDLVIELKFIGQCVKETLRKFPGLSNLTRECTRNYTIPSSGVALEKGTLIGVSVSGIHYDPSIYPDPENFDPERFSNENVAKRHPCSFLPFGYGPRNCIAYQFGFFVASLAVAQTVYNFRFKLNPKTTVPLIKDPKNFVSRPLGGIYLDLTKIQCN